MLAMPGREGSSLHTGALRTGTNMNSRNKQKHE